VFDLTILMKDLIEHLIYRKLIASPVWPDYKFITPHCSTVQV